MAEVIGGMTGALQGTATSVLNKGQSYLDRFFPPERRNALWAKFSKFAAEKPMLASFLLSQFALTGVPLGLFVIMTITVLVFALLAGLIIGVLGALVFTVFCVGVALLVLLPTIFITTFAGAFIWMWGVGAYYLLKWFNQKDIPGIHTNLVGEKSEETSGDSAESEEPTQEEPMQEEPVQANGGAEKKEGGTPKKQENGGAKHPKKEEKGMNGKVPGGDKVGDVGKATGLDKAADTEGLKKKADIGKVKGAVPGGAL